MNEQYELGDHTWTGEATLGSLGEHARDYLDERDRFARQASVMLHPAGVLNRNQFFDRMERLANPGVQQELL